MVLGTPGFSPPNAFFYYFKPFSGCPSGWSDKGYLKILLGGPMGLACPALCKGETQSKAVLTLCDAMRLLIFFFFGMAQYVQAWCKATKRYKAKQAIDFVLHAQTNGIGFFHFLKSAVFERMPRGGTSYALGTVRNATTILETKFFAFEQTACVASAFLSLSPCHGQQSFFHGHSKGHRRSQNGL